MDIARPEIKRQKRRRQIIWSSVALLVLIGATVGITRLKPAAPAVDRSTIWTDTVKRGPMLRQVRGLGSLIPSHEDVRQIPAETEATVIRIVKLPGSQVEPDTVLVEMSNPQLEQEALDAQLQVKAAQAEFQSLKVKAGVAGVLVDLPLQVGQHVLPGTELAKIVQPNHLMAELKIPETQARDVQIGEPASIDTHNGVIPGTVSRVDPAVQNGTVTVDVSLTGE